MLKNISNLGKTLNKTEQQSINGGKLLYLGCQNHSQCPGDDNYCTASGDCVWCPGNGMDDAVCAHIVW
jgi:hypothetical protein